MFLIKEIRYQIIIHLDTKSLSRIIRSSKNLITDDFWQTKFDYENLSMRNGDDNQLVELDRVLNSHIKAKHILKTQNNIIIIRFGDLFYQFLKYLSFKLNIVRCKQIRINNNNEVAFDLPNGSLPLIRQFGRKDITEIIECAYYTGFLI